VYTHIKGDSFDVAGPLFWMQNGARVLDLTHYTGACQLRTERGELIDTLVFEWTDAANSLCRLSKLDTSAWPISERPLVTDIKLTSPAGFVRRTSVAQVMVVKSVTE
jgi:hypothetical protein